MQSKLTDSSRHLFTSNRSVLLFQVVTSAATRLSKCSSAVEEETYQSSASRTNSSPETYAGLKHPSIPPERLGNGNFSMIFKVTQSGFSGISNTMLIRCRGSDSVEC